MGVDEGDRLVAGEEAGGGADGADAARADGAGELEAAEFVEAGEDAGDVAGVEGVAAPRAVDEGDGVGPEPRLEAVRDDHRAAIAAGDDDPAGPHGAEGLGLADRVALAEDQGRLVGVGEEDVGLGEDRTEVLQVVGGAGRGDVEHRDRASTAGEAEAFGEGLGLDAREDQVAAEVDDPGVAVEQGVEVGGGQGPVRAEGMDEAAVLALDVDDEGLARSPTRVDAEETDVDAPVSQGVGHESAEDVVADPAADRRGDAELGQGHRGVRGAAADVQDEVVGLDELAGGRDVVNRRAQVVGDEDPRADHGDLIGRAGRSVDTGVGAPGVPKGRGPGRSGDLGFRVGHREGDRLDRRLGGGAGTLADQVLDLGDGKDLTLDQGLGDTL